MEQALAEYGAPGSHDIVSGPNRAGQRSALLGDDPAGSGADLVEYGSGQNALPLSVSIFVPRDELRAQLSEDALALGFRLGSSGRLAELLSGDIIFPLGDIVIVECDEVSAEVLAALARLDMRAAQSGAQVILATTMEALDSVFGCIDQSGPQILVNPSAADRVVAMGSAIAGLAHSRLRELGEDERVLLLKLTEEVGRIAREVENLSGQFAASQQDVRGAERPSSGGARGDGPKLRWSGAVGDYDPEVREEYTTPQRAKMPDPVLVRRIIRMRQMRGRYFDSQQFSDPAWDILLDLTAAKAERKRVSVTSLCIASGVPPTTALRWIAQMTDAGMLERMEDPADRRRAFIRLGESTAEAMAHYFDDIIREGVLAI